MMPKNISHIKMSFCNEEKRKKLFQELPIYNALIEKPYIKRLNNIDLLHKPPFYNELSIKKYLEHLKGMQEVIEKIDLKANYCFR